jgi:hypothetical protein
MVAATGRRGLDEANNLTYWNTIHISPNPASFELSAIDRVGVWRYFGVK